jgi:hypothetical protein
MKKINLAILVAIAVQLFANPVFAKENRKPNSIALRCGKTGKMITISAEKAASLGIKALSTVAK